MKTFATLIAAALVAVGTAQPAAAQTQFGEEDAIVLNAQSAYIFFRTPARTTWRFLRAVTEAERVEHEARRLAALAEERTRYTRRLREYDRFRQDCPAGNRSAYCSRRLERPVEPTEANFAFLPAEADNWVSNAYRPRLINQDAWSGWLIAVEPGTYTLYGEIIEGQNGITGTCFCMGSVRFEARAGQITDMGEVVPAPEDQRAEITSTTFRLGHVATVLPASPALRSPPQFGSLPVVAAELRAADHLPNYFGVTVSRLAPVDGVLGYRRGQVLDLRASASAAAGTAE